MAPASAGLLSVPGDHATIQAALDVATAGDTIEVASGTYFEKVEFKSSGTIGNPIVLTAVAGHSPILDGTGVSGDNVILIEDRSFVQVIGLEIRNNLGTTDGSGIRILGAGTNIELRDNVIHDMRGKNAMGITVYATKASPVENLVIDGNHIFDCEPEPSEALVLNGNVTDWEVTNNVVEDVNNIAIDFIGGETDIQPNSNLVARNGVCRGNAVARCGSGFSGGIYVDGGKDIVIENNEVTECDLGIEVAAENAGLLTENITVRNNVLYSNRVVGIVFGGFNGSVGLANDNVFRGNTLYKNATSAGDGIGEIWVQFGNNNVLENNIVYARSAADGGVPNVMVTSFNNSSGNTFDYNLYFTEDGAASAEFGLNNAFFTGFASWQGNGEDGNSIFGDPLFVNAAAADFHIASASPAGNAGDPGYVVDVGETDLDGSSRQSGPSVDIGADELTCGDSVPDTGEECDDGNLIDGDGCDSNCTLTACGNGILTAGESCDDGNLDAGDCCSASCDFEVATSPCDDGVICTRVDACDGLGACVGDPEPTLACLEPSVAGGSSIKIKDKGNSDSLSWKWGKGPEVLLSALGDPATSDDYTLCLYLDQGAGSSIFASLTAPGGDEWLNKETKGFKYSDGDLTPDGVKQVSLRPGAVGKAKIKLKGRGPGMALGTLGFGAPSSLVVQLHGPGGACFGAGFSAPYSTDTAVQFKAKSTP